jgi:hypothetical protein
MVPAQRSLARHRGKHRHGDKGIKLATVRAKGRRSSIAVNPMHNSPLPPFGVGPPAFTHAHAVSLFLFALATEPFGHCARGALPKRRERRASAPRGV